MIEYRNVLDRLACKENDDNVALKAIKIILENFKPKQSTGNTQTINNIIINRNKGHENN